MTAKNKKKARNRDNTPDPSTLWPNRLAEARQEAGMTQTELADAASALGKGHVGQTTIAAIETGRNSGRHQMNRIAEALGEQPEDIFPYARFISVAEAARARGTTPDKIRSSGIPLYPIKSTQFVLPEDVIRVTVPRKPEVSASQRMRDLSKQYGPMTVAELTDALGPYKSLEDKIRRKNTIMVTLSRSPEFVADKSTYPARWKFVQSRFARKGKQKTAAHG